MCHYSSSTLVMSRVFQECVGVCANVECMNEVVRLS
jgi:hypothetical protein